MRNSLDFARQEQSQRLFGFAEDLLATLSTLPGTVSKAKRVYRLE